MPIIPSRMYCIVSYEVLLCCSALIIGCGSPSILCCTTYIGEYTQTPDHVIPLCTWSVDSTKIQQNAQQTASSLGLTTQQPKPKQVYTRVKCQNLNYLEAKTKLRRHSLQRQMLQDPDGNFGGVSYTSLNAFLTCMKSIPAIGCIK